MQNIDLVEVLIVLVVLISSLSVHEAAHAFAADRLGDPTARQLGRLSLNPAVHVDLIGTIVFPLIAFLTGVPLIGWAKPVPVNMRFLKHPKRDFALIAAAGPASNLIMAAIGAVVLAIVRGAAGPGDIAGGAVTGPLEVLVLSVHGRERPAGRVQHDSRAAARRRQRAARRVAAEPGPEWSSNCGRTAS